MTTSASLASPSHVTSGRDRRFLIVEASVSRVHALPEIVVPGTSHIDTGAWSPLICNFGLGPELGRSFRAEH